MGEDYSNRIFINSSDKSFSLQPEGHTKLLTIVFTGQWFTQNFLQDEYCDVQIIKRITDNQSLLLTMNLDLRMMRIVKEIFTLKLSSSVKATYLRGAIFSLLSLVIKNIIEKSENIAGIKDRDMQAVQRQTAYIQRNILQSIPTVEESARACNMCKSKFSVVFKKIYGKKYGEVFAELRLQKTIELLKTGSKISEVSKQSGFSTCSQFIKFFKANLKLTPKEYQKQLQPVTRAQIQ
jgi:AraC-like DNA-binding protein